MISRFEHQRFFKSTYLRAQEDLEENSDIDFDSELLALSIGDEIRAIRALLLGVWDPEQKSSFYCRRILHGCIPPGEML